MIWLKVYHLYFSESKKLETASITTNFKDLPQLLLFWFFVFFFNLSKFYSYHVTIRQHLDSILAPLRLTLHSKIVK